MIGAGIMDGDRVIVKQQGDGGKRRDRLRPDRRRGNVEAVL